MKSGVLLLPANSGRSWSARVSGHSVALPRAQRQRQRVGALTQQQ